MPNRFRCRPLPWAVILAFALVYLSWGTTYFAIRRGVHNDHLPPALFGGTRVCLAGLLLLGFLAARREPLRLPLASMAWVSVSGLLLFVLGNGLVTYAMDNVPSGTASVLVATTPLWMALMEFLLPRGDRLSTRGWLGLLTGLAGVVILVGGRLRGSLALAENVAPLLLLASSLSWSLGSLVVRHRGPTGSHLAAAAYQMVIGGGILTLLGLAAGESRQLTPALFTPAAMAAFFYLLVVGSLVGFVAFNWLLGQVPAPVVGTYAYVNPVIAILLGWLADGDPLTSSLLAGMAIILTGVALVRGAARKTTAQRYTFMLPDRLSGTLSQAQEVEVGGKGQSA